MTLLSIKNLSCEMGGKQLFEGATFSIEEQDKIAVIGPNGCGKSTLLSLIEHAIKSPINEIAVQKGLRINALAQDPDLNPSHSIKDHLYQSKSDASLAIQNYHEQLESYNKEQSPEIEEAYSAALEQMDHLNLWEYEERVSSLLSELRIHDLEQKISELSGGMRKKIALAQTFIEDSDLFVLDEPTNHLDIQTIEWLESMLKKQRSAIIMVTHDRYFLDKICTKIIEIDQNKVFVYNGNYQCYLEQREQRYLSQQKEESKVRSVLRVELQWLKRGPKARSTKQKARKDRIATMQNRKQITTKDALSLEVSERRLGKKILKINELSKSFAGKQLIKQFSYTLSKGSKIGILGPNGVGKTTLLNMIMQREKPDSGEIDIGVNTVFAYFDQHSGDFDLDDTIYEHINSIGSQFQLPDGSTMSASKLLERFLFTSEMFKTKIKDLSGGERRRLYLVCLLLQNPNVLLFDEPTNDLDIQTLSILEDFLQSFSGCVIIISHDRYFMDRVVNQLLVFNKKAEILPFQGNYSDYIDTLTLIEELRKKEKKSSKKGLPQQSSSKQNNDHEKHLKKIEAKIEKLEAEKETIVSEGANANLSAADYQRLGQDIKQITERIESAYEEWEALASNLEK